MITAKEEIGDLKRLAMIEFKTDWESETTENWLDQEATFLNKALE